MVRVLLTGATGLIGRSAARTLTDAGHEVIALSRHGQVNGGGQSIACDLLEPSQVSATIGNLEATHLLHLAWHDSPKNRWISPANLDWMSATVNLIQHFASAGGQRVVCAGSCAEYDWSDAELSEVTPLRPRTLYGAAKAGTGMALGNAGPALGLSIAWARVFFVYGPGETSGRLLGDLIANLSANKSVDCTDGLQERDFLHTDDLARALAKLLTSDVTGALNIASGNAIPVRDLIIEVASQMGKPELVRLGAVPRSEDDPARLVADVTRLRREIGFEPQHRLASGVAATLASEGLT